MSNYVPPKQFELNKTSRGSSERAEMLFLSVKSNKINIFKLNQPHLFVKLLLLIKVLLL